MHCLLHLSATWRYSSSQGWLAPIQFCLERKPNPQSLPFGIGNYPLRYHILWIFFPGHFRSALSSALSTAEKSRLYSTNDPRDRIIPKTQNGWGLESLLEWSLVHRVPLLGRTRSVPYFVNHPVFLKAIESTSALTRVWWLPSHFQGSSLL